MIDQLRAVVRQPEIVAGTWKAVRTHADGITEDDARAALQQIDPLGDELFALVVEGFSGGVAKIVAIQLDKEMRS